jgi:hypothetical protein
MPDIFVALIVGFILGLLVGFLMRSESRRFENPFSSQEHTKHWGCTCGAGRSRLTGVCTDRMT